ncbi:MAG: hypothetical protein FJX47_18645 [Alphaproteobacteria bacterium]|nr:hypothetical protein [Alphaproteobacteria bacterium]
MRKLIVLFAAFLMAGAAFAQDKAADKSKAKAEPLPEFGDPMRLEYFGVPLIVDKKIAGYVMFQAAFQVPKGKLEDAKRTIPELQDAILREFYRRAMRPDKSDEAELRRRIMAVVEQVVPAGLIHGVEFQRLAKTN